MTISEYIVDFLKAFEEIEIDQNHVAEGSDKYGLFKSPSRDVKEYTDSSYEITEYYQFMARQRAIADSERKEADEFLEDLTYKIDDYGYTENYPDIDNGRTVTKIAITGCPYPAYAEGKDAMYQMTIAITYERER